MTRKQLNMRPVWTSGMFMLPQHFQAAEAHSDAVLHRRVSDAAPYAYGFRRLEIDTVSLQRGQFRLHCADAVFEDGVNAAFDDADGSDDGPVLQLEPADAGHLIYLCVPRRAGAQNLSRWITQSIPTRDMFTPGAADDDRADVVYRKANLVLRSGRDDLTDFVTLPVARVSSVRAGSEMAVDPDYLPPAITLDAYAGYGRFIDAMCGKLDGFIKNLMRIASTGHGARSQDLRHIILLQTLVRHRAALDEALCGPYRTPCGLFRALSLFAADMQIFGADVFEAEQNDARPRYVHSDTGPVLGALRDRIFALLHPDTQPSARQMPLQEQGEGLYFVPLSDVLSLAGMRIVIIVRGACDPEFLGSAAQRCVRIVPYEDLRTMIRHQLPGLGLRLLTRAPRGVPYHDDAVYFDLDLTEDDTQRISGAAGLGLQILPSEFDISLALWEMDV